MKKNLNCFDGKGNVINTEVYEWKQEVYERDNGCCKVCGNDEPVDVYEINPDKSDLQVNNGVVLCEHCYKKLLESNGHNWLGLEKLMNQKGKTLRKAIKSQFDTE